MNVLRLLCLLILTCNSHAEPDNAADPYQEAAKLYRDSRYDLAFPKFLALAESGDAKAQTITALMYKFGEGTPQDHEQAFRWYLTAATQGYSVGQFHTGLMLAEGVGTNQNSAAAIEWLTLAAEQGFDRAIKKLTELNTSPEVLGQTDSQLTAWSKDWDLKLPTDLLLNDSEQEPIELDPVYLVQIGAMGTRTDANKLWRVLKERHNDLFANREPIISLVENVERRVYQVQTGPFENYQSADEFCQRLLSSRFQAGCLPQKQD